MAVYAVSHLIALVLAAYSLAFCSLVFAFLLLSISISLLLCIYIYRHARLDKNSAQFAMAAPSVDIPRTSSSPSAGPSNPQQNTGPEQSSDRRSPKSKSTKAERRALQEKQRAEKAALTAPKGGEKGSTKNKESSRTGISQISGSSSTARRPTVSGSDAQRPVFSSKTVGRDTSTLGDEVGNHTRGLRIFSHFGQPKAPSNVKGDIHPAIVRLGLQFSAFKITGANARCIATLIAFKTVISSLFCCITSFI